MWNPFSINLFLARNILEESKNPEGAQNAIVSPSSNLAGFTSSNSDSELQEKIIIADKKQEIMILLRFKALQKYVRLKIFCKTSHRQILILFYYLNNLINLLELFFYWQRKHESRFFDQSQNPHERLKYHF